MRVTALTIHQHNKATEAGKLYHLDNHGDRTQNGELVLAGIDNKTTEQTVGSSMYNLA